MKTKPPKRGRPRVLHEIAFLNFRLEKSVLAELHAYARWRAFTEGRAISLRVAILDAIRESQSFQAFVKATKPR